ncbi:hypothetical protein QJS10_CPB19g00320 [Acorus calamus]|uniref:NYN domain-containing protein n=1 Tax=Acorus calamus TaxID=4465 RepID=A0AAV9CGC2_ACOCL|nr:hypothetical protein QJS10_CPB19g00320 [Acorus calamus]
MEDEIARVGPDAFTYQMLILVGGDSSFSMMAPEAFKGGAHAWVIPSREVFDRVANNWGMDPLPLWAFEREHYEGQTNRKRQILYCEGCSGHALACD